MAVAIDVEITGNGTFAGAKSSIDNYRVTEDSTPTEASDSSGGTGQISFDAIEDPSRFGTVLLLNDTVTLTDGDRGTTQGTINSASSNDGLVSITADSRLGRLVVEKTAAPAHDIFPNVMRYYLGLAGLTTNVAIDASFNSITVNAPGWSGDLWTKIKELCVTYGAEISLLRTAVAVRPIRQLRALEFNNAKESWTISNRDMARFVEVNYYNSVWRSGAMIYPKGGWDESIPVYTVDPGEALFVNIPIDVSVESVIQPGFYTNVAKNYIGPGTSAYTALGNDGAMIPQVDWTRDGGNLTVARGEDGKSIDVAIYAPRVGTPSAAFGPFRIGQQDINGNVYSTLRIMGVGLHYNKQTVTVPTGADEAITSRDIGVTVDNLFVATESQARSLALDVASRWASPSRKLNITKSAVNRPGDITQSFDYATIGEFDTYAVANGQSTFALFDTAWSGKTFGQFDDFWYQRVQNNFDFQVFGNAVGARVAYRRAMWRIRSIDISAGEISYTAEEDTTVGDFDASAAGMTIGQFDTSYAGLTFADFALIPLPVVLPQYDRF